MNRQELLNKLIIQPKSLTVRDGFYQKNRVADICTNVEGVQMSYLLELAGYQKKVQIRPFEGLENECVLCIGPKIPKKKKYCFENDEAFWLEAEQDSIAIIGKTPEGMLLGLKSLIRMLSKRRNCL